MTINELIEKLKEMQDKSYGDYKVVSGTWDTICELGDDGYSIDHEHKAICLY